MKHDERLAEKRPPLDDQDQQQSRRELRGQDEEDRRYTFHFKVTLNQLQEQNS